MDVNDYNDPKQFLNYTFDRVLDMPVDNQKVWELSEL